MKEKYFLTTLFLLFSLCFGCHLTGGYGLKASLNNPTEYHFNASVEEIENALAQLADDRERMENAGVLESQVYEGYVLIVNQHYSKYYRIPDNDTGKLASGYDIEITQERDNALV